LDNVYGQSWAFDQSPWQVDTFGDQLRFYVMAGPSLLDLRHDYLELTGTPPVPPRKASGLWVSEFGYDDFDHADLRRRRAPLVSPPHHPAPPAAGLLEPGARGDCAAVGVGGSTAIAGLPNSRRNVVRLVVDNLKASAVSLNGTPLAEFPTEAAFVAANSGWRNAGPNRIDAKSPSLAVTANKVLEVFAAARIRDELRELRVRQRRHPVRRERLRQRRYPRPRQLGPRQGYQARTQRLLRIHLEPAPVHLYP
jgi:hypothetical protein